MKRSNSWLSVMPSLVMPLAIGAMLYMGLSAAIQNELIGNENITRYLTGHPISKITTALFFIGGASLVMIGLNIFEQFRWEKKIGLRGPEASDGAGSANSQITADSNEATEFGSEMAVDDGCGLHLQELESLPEKVHEHYLWKRLYAAIEFISRSGSASNVEEELKYLADNDHHAQTQRYSLVRIMIWAMPMLGFLGTVLGISQALGGLNIGPDNDFSAVIGSLQTSLYVAFDTTALALCLSIVLMFCTFLVERFEMQLLDQVDLQARQEIAKQFDFTGKPDSAVQTMERIGRQVLIAARDSVEKQAEIWRTSFDRAEDAWMIASAQTHEQIRVNLGSAINDSVENMADLLSQAIFKADESLATRWEQWQITLSDNARNINEQQAGLLNHTQLLETLIQKLENVGQFQTALNKNLDGLATTGRLEATLSSLNSVIIDLNRKLGKQIVESKLKAGAHQDSPVETIPFRLHVPPKRAA